MEPVRWGILSTARINHAVIVPARETEKAMVIAVASRDLGRAETYAREQGIERPYGSYEALLADDDVEAVYVSLPNALHVPWSIKALEAGKHVLCEKPLALSVDDVDAIIAAAERAGRIAVEGFMYLHHPQILRAVELARSGALGQLELVNGSFSFFLTYPDDPRVDPTMGGGSLWDVGCYPVTFARRIAAELPDRVAAFARFDEHDVDRTFIGQLRFPGGLLAQFDSGFAAPDRERLEVVGSDATLVLGSPFLPEPEGPPPTLTLWRGRDATGIPVASVDQYAAEVDDLSAAILDGTTPRMGLDFSRGTIATLVDLDDAARINAGLPLRRPTSELA